MKSKIINSVTSLEEKIGKKTGFSSPKNYFNNLEEVINAKLIEEALPKAHGFKISDNYFNSLEDQIILKTKKEEAQDFKQTKVISLKDRLLKIIPLAAAASIILFIGLNSYILDNNNTTNLNQISDDDMEYFLESNAIHTIDIAAVFNDDFENESILSLTTIEDESIEDYMSSIDNTYLLNELD
mgnify:CR=1 FL=1|jgi:hypothetical protein